MLAALWYTFITRNLHSTFFTKLFLIECFFSFLPFSTMECCGSVNCFLNDHIWFVTKGSQFSLTSLQQKSAHFGGKGCFPAVVDFGRLTGK